MHRGQNAGPAVRGWSKRGSGGPRVVYLTTDTKLFEESLKLIWFLVQVMVSVASVQSIPIVWKLSNLDFHILTPYTYISTLCSLVVLHKQRIYSSFQRILFINIWSNQSLKLPFLLLILLLRSWTWMDQGLSADQSSANSSRSWCVLLWIISRILLMVSTCWQSAG